ncbi:MAG TPA: transposase [Alphaproteobacteria bacterium]
MLGRDWPELVDRLGGSGAIGALARASGAFRRARGFGDAVDLLRLILAYCLGDKGLRLTAAWAASVGLADVSNVALLKRLRNCGDWLAHLVGHALAQRAPQAARGRLIRIVDGTTVAKAGGAGRGNRLWRVHCAFDVPCERFGFFELTDEKGGETLDRAPVLAGEIRIGDRAYLQPGRIAAVLAAGADVIIRAGWKSARWRDLDGAPFDLVAALRAADRRGHLDRPLALAVKGGPLLTVRLVAIKKPADAVVSARRKARREAQRGGHRLSPQTLTAADWVILVTSLARETFSRDDILALYRLRWRIELAFKRLKSLVGLKGPPGSDVRSARPYLLAHLLLILLLEPLADELEDSPRSAAA